MPSSSRGTGDLETVSARMQRATIRVYHDREHPSQISLHVAARLGPLRFNSAKKRLGPPRRRVRQRLEGRSPTALFRGHYAIREGSLGRNYDVAPDGRLLMLKRETTPEAPHLVVVQNWMSGLAQQVR